MYQADSHTVPDDSHTMDTGHTLNLPLRGRALRFVLVDELRGRETMTVAQMVAVLAHHGYDLGGRASKVISDALRWELARDRVQRLRRGVYRYHHAPVSTARRIRIFAATCRTWLVATTRIQPPNETPDHDETRPQPQPQPQAQARARAREHLDPNRPPWEHLGWLWAG